MSKSTIPDALFSEISPPPSGVATYILPSSKKIKKELQPLGKNPTTKKMNKRIKDK